MINKEKLLKEIKLKSDDVDVTWVCSFIKNFPEEPEQPIDFDALYKEYSGSVQFDSTQSAWGFRDFLKSKNLTAPNPVDIPVECPSCGCPSFKIEESMMCSACGTVFELTRKLEIPVKRTWTLKKHVEETFHDFGNTPYPLTSDPPENLKKYYDQHEEPDYSKIPKGSIVELKHGFIRRFLYPLNDKLFMKMDCESCTTDEEFSNIIRIVELAKEKV